MSVDIEAVKEDLCYLAAGDHMGDTNDALPSLCRHLDLPEPTWDDKNKRFYMAWEPKETDS